MKANNPLLNSVPAANELRKVSGFNPLKYLRQVSAPKNGEKLWKLELPYKRLWFRLACPNGRMVVKPLRITDQMAVFEALVYAQTDDEEPLSRFAASVSPQDVSDGKYVEAAQEAALDAALENAGFGIQLCDFVQTTGSSRYGSEISASAVVNAKAATVLTATPISVVTAAPVETPAPTVTTAPVETPAPTVTAVPVETPAPTVTAVPVETPAPAATSAQTTTPVNSVQMLINSEKTETAKQNEPSDHAQQIQSDPNYTADMTVEDICKVMTMEKAKAYVVQGGICKGWTLEQVAERRAPSLKFYVCSNTGDNVLKAAATLVLQELNQRKAG